MDEGLSRLTYIYKSLEPVPRIACVCTFKEGHNCAYYVYLTGKPPKGLTRLNLGYYMHLKKLVNG